MNQDLVGSQGGAPWRGPLERTLRSSGPATAEALPSSRPTSKEGLRQRSCSSSTSLSKGPWGFGPRRLRYAARSYRVTPLRPRTTLSKVLACAFPSIFLRWDTRLREVVHRPDSESRVIPRAYAPRLSTITPDSRSRVTHRDLWPRKYVEAGAPPISNRNFARTGETPTRRVSLQRAGYFVSAQRPASPPAPNPFSHGLHRAMRIGTRTSDLTSTDRAGDRSPSRRVRILASRDKLGHSDVHWDAARYRPGRSRFVQRARTSM
jgi:hypothetical protein